MIWSRSTLSPDVRLQLDCERNIAVLPAAARSRALSRARAALAAGVATQPIPARAPPAVRWAAAAGLAFVAAVATGAGAYTVGVRARPIAPLVAASPRTESRPPDLNAVNEPILDLLAAELLAKPGARSEAGAVPVELHLLEQARAAVARGDFMAAMPLLAEHAHRFRTGRLVEEREALRVRSLVGLGRRRDARRAAADFEATFPRSPLRIVISQALGSAP